MARQRPHRTPADRARRLIGWATRLEVLQVRLLGRSTVSLTRGTDVLVLETVGRRTGRRRRVVVSYLEDDGAFLVGGGAGGMTRVDWVANLRAQPKATVWVRRRRIPVTAHEIGEGEHEAVQAKAFARWPYAPRYEEISGRRIPYFRLVPLVVLGCVLAA